MFEEKEKEVTNLNNLIDLVERDSIPTNEFTTEDKDPMVILGKMGIIEAHLKMINDLITNSDSKASEALLNAIQALTTANNAITGTNTALNTSNTALDTANTALTTSNEAYETANTANELSNEAVNTSNQAKLTAEDVLNRVINGLGTKLYRGNTLLSTYDIKTIEDTILNYATRISNVEGRASSNTDNITNLSTRIQTNATNIQNNTNNIQNNTNSIQNNTNSIQTLTENVSLNKQNIARNEAYIELLDSKKLNIADLINMIYPVNSIYISKTLTSPASFIGGVWELLPADKTLWLSQEEVINEIEIEPNFEDEENNIYPYNTRMLKSGLPNITGYVNNVAMRIGNGTSIGKGGAFTGSGDAGQSNADGSGSNAVNISFSATNSNAIYGKSTIVQPPAYRVYAWLRIE